MAESRNVTGSKDDLLADASRCMLMRFSESSCRLCFDICPHGAVSLDGGLSINPQQCRGCLLCTAVCPVGALEQSSDFSACLARLSKVPEPILGCVRTNECSNGTVACLGGLSEEHLLALCHTLTGRLTLNLSLCGDCPNNPMITRLRQRLDAISEAGLSDSRCHINFAESAQDIHYRDESVDRRSFFKSFSNALFKNAAVILSATNEQTERRTEYAGKRLPIRRKLLNSTRNKLSQELVVRIRKHFDSCVSFDDTCTRCQGCAAICPTGALQTELSDIPPTFDQLLCTCCGLCREFCMDGALRISTGNSEDGAG
ncbi:4Fe-4S binding protein [Geotalea uraniireducens]|uniref:4Fe-4S ferredoxin, iron-sulfur binding domain protein n=1 Tax=Geotalea uraniireducens (strain Rf4) TaxID=351605 RepID=A5GCL6_GEOUR|nr:4Fe-4S binding protein [Geotalea uraniireducens]ABQ24688.1 4Fe-4S ferredoxin, iron-sulfur binding domain protein [Geotalea uraniireducens Rf4]